MNPWIVHYKNKYPGAEVRATENSLDVFQNGEHKVALVKDGGGSWTCKSAEMGCVDAHDLAPIPRDARVYKIVDVKKGNAKNGEEVLVKGIGIDAEEGEKRKKSHKEFLCERGHKVLSCADLKKKGYDFDEKHRISQRPAKKENAEKSGDSASSDQR